MVQGVRAGGVGGSAPPARDGTRTVEGHFSVDDGAARLAPNTRLSTVTSIGLEGLLSLQSVDEAVERDRAARKRGTAMIGALTKLQRAMLAGEDPALALRALNELTGDANLADDPGLNAILRAVVLRSRIEMARRALPGVDARAAGTMAEAPGETRGQTRGETRGETHFVTE